MKTRKIVYDRKRGRIECGSIEQDHRKEVIQDLLKCVESITGDSDILCFFSTINLNQPLTQEDIVMLNLSLRSDYEVVTRK